MSFVFSYRFPSDILKKKTWRTSAGKILPMSFQENINIFSRMYVGRWCIFSLPTSCWENFKSFYAHKGFDPKKKNLWWEVLRYSVPSTKFWATFISSSCLANLWNWSDFFFEGQKNFIGVVFPYDYWPTKNLSVKSFEISWRLFVQVFSYFHWLHLVLDRVL